MHYTFKVLNYDPFHQYKLTIYGLKNVLLFKSYVSHFKPHKISSQTQLLNSSYRSLHHLLLLLKDFFHLTRTATPGYSTPVTYHIKFMMAVTRKLVECMST